MSKSLHTILSALDDAQFPAALPNPVIEHITADSRAVRPGSLFVAVAGGTFDGHDYIAAALDQGAVAVIGARPRAEIPALGQAEHQAIPHIQVAEPRLALAQACAALEDFPSRAMTVIGVTGTDGKTTTCTLLEAILRAQTHSATHPDGTVGVVTTVGARIGGAEIDTGFHVTTPDAPEVQRFLAQMRDGGCSHAIVESTSHGLAQGRVAAVDFDVAAVTNITHEHLDYHGSRAAYVAAKAQLFRALFRRTPKPGIAPFAVLNRDDTGSYAALVDVLAEEAALAEETATGGTVSIYTYGIPAGISAGISATQASNGAGSDTRGHAVWAEAVAYHPDRTEVQVRWWGGAFTLVSTLIGEFNVYNMLCAATVGLGLGVAPQTIQRGIAAVAGVIGRMERIDAGQPFLAIVDFAHSPVSLERALHTLRPLVGTRPDGAPGRLIAVFGCAGLRDRAKRRLMGEASGRLADFTVVTAEDPRTESLDDINRAIAGGLLAAGAATRYTIIDDRAAAINHAVEMAQPGDVVAAFGKGHERSMCFGTTEYPWSDQEAMRRALQARNTPDRQT